VARFSLATPAVSTPLPRREFVIVSRPAAPPAPRVKRDWGADPIAPVRPSGSRRSRRSRRSRWPRRVVGLVFLALVIAGGLYVFLPPPGPRLLTRFDAPRVADLEFRVWRSYYNREPVQLFMDIASMMREQYHYSWATAATEAFFFARACIKFRDFNGNYEDVVLPDLEHGYATAQLWLHAGYDPRRVARAELAWWVSRRVTGHSDPQQLGRLMATQYALLFEVPKEQVLKAATLRAQAETLRDVDGNRPQWDEVARLLREAYVELHARVAAVPPSRALASANAAQN
jgi:hypothetical protein